MNHVERSFEDLTDDCIQPGSFTSAKDLTDSITSYFVNRNKDPRPYGRKASGADILAKTHRARQALAEVSVGQR